MRKTGACLIHQVHQVRAWGWKCWGWRQSLPRCSSLSPGRARPTNPGTGSGKCATAQRRTCTTYALQPCLMPTWMRVRTPSSTKARNCWGFRHPRSTSRPTAGKWASRATGEATCWHVPCRATYTTAALWQRPRAMT